MNQGTRSFLDLNTAFTLLELMISLTIVALILVVIFGSFRVGVRAWEKGEEDIESRQRERIVLNLIRRQLTSAFAGKLRQGDQQPLFLRGNDKSMEFLSYISIFPGHRVGIVHTKYLVKPQDDGEKERLVFCEKNLFRQVEGMEKEETDEEDFFELISGIHDIGFEYCKGQGGEEILEWQRTWDPVIDKGFPRAVRVSLKEDVETPPIRMIVRIESGLSWEQSDEKTPAE